MSGSYRIPGTLFKLALWCWSDNMAAKMVFITDRKAARMLRSTPAHPKFKVSPYIAWRSAPPMRENVNERNPIIVPARNIALVKERVRYFNI